LNLPPFGPDSGAASDARRIAAFNTVLGKLAIPADGSFSIGDLSSWLTANGGAAIAPTSEGFGANAADLVVKGYLAPQIAALAAAIGSDPTTTTAPPADGPTASSTTSSADPGVTVTPATSGA
jgi:hypothetical protein